MSSIQILPAILATTEQEYKDKLDIVNSCDAFDHQWIQLDLMDGEFVNNKSIDPEVIKKYPVNFKIEAQLMVTKPLLWVQQLKDFKISRWIIPVEINHKDIKDCVDFIKEQNLGQIGFSINPQTPVNKLDAWSDIARSVLIMGVEPGFGGQEFLPQTLDKIKSVARLKTENSLNFLIGVDGGINQSNIKSIIESGANYAAVGSSLINGDINQNLEDIWESAGS